MRTKLTLLALTFAGAATIILTGLTGCASLGANPRPPTKAESLLFATVTNVVTVTKTVEVPVAVWSTNVVTVVQTNLQNQIVTNVANIVNETWRTNTVVAQVLQTNYTETLKPSAASVIQAGGSALNAVVPGLGGLISTGLVALLGGWGYLRSSKQGTATTGALTQEIETVREFVKALPNGQIYDNALVTFLQSHQSESGIVQKVAGALLNDVSNPDAKVAAQEVINAVNALKVTVTPLPNVSATPSA